MPLIKPLMGRLRPPGFQRIPVGWDFYGFPRGHSLDATRLALALCVHLWRSGSGEGATAVGGVLMGAWIAIVGLSRVALGVHYPTDVLGGMLLSSMWIIALMASRIAVDRQAALGDCQENVAFTGSGHARLVPERINTLGTAHMSGKGWWD